MAEMQQTLVVIKPDGVQRGLIGPILTRFEQRGFRILALKLITVGQQMAETHYAVHQGKFFYPDLVSYINSGPVLAMVLEGIDAIKAVRLMVGSTRPYEAAPGTIRGDYALTGLRNLIHASDAPETAQAEIALWFTHHELQTYQRDIDKWIYE
jgi:nucleoside-diphosphate kinase